MTTQFSIAERGEEIVAPLAMPLINLLSNQDWLAFNRDDKKRSPSTLSQPTPIGDQAPPAPTKGDGSSSVQAKSEPAESRTFRELMLAGFEIADENKDGKVTSDEVEKAFAKNTLSEQDSAAVAVMKAGYNRIANFNTHTVTKVARWLTGPLGGAVFSSNIEKDDIERLCTLHDEAQKRLHNADLLQRNGESVIAKLDTNRDNKLSQEELAKDLNAAASADENSTLTVMRDNFRALARASGDGSGISVADLKAHARSWRIDGNDDIALALTADRIAKPALQGHLDSELFADADDPLKSIHPNAIRQGRLGDCYFLAALASVASIKPEAIRDMIKDNKDGTYTVTFPASPNEPITVAAPTAQELSFYARSSEYGIWPAVMEKAYGQYLKNSFLRRLFPLNVVPEDQPQDNAGGGSAWHAGLYVLTGKIPAKYVFAPITSLDVLDDHLSKAFDESRPVTAYRFGNLIGRDNEIPGGHEYSVLAYDSKTRMVTIRNPWGHTEPLDQWGAAKDGTNDGVYTMPLAEFKKNFSGVAIARASVSVK